jgi:hypothetical protein
MAASYPQPTLQRKRPETFVFIRSISSATKSPDTFVFIHPLYQQRDKES